MKKTFIAASFGLAFALPSVEAALFDFSYVASGGTLAGTVDGTLQADNNTVVVNSLLDFVAVNGVAGPSLPNYGSWDVLSGYSAIALPTFTLNGSYLDFVACTAVNCFGGDAMAFGVGNSVSSAAGRNVYSAAYGGFFGNGPETFNQANWNLVAHSSVPAPATLPLLALGGAAMAWRRRKGL